jgi:hypothetical protein
MRTLILATVVATSCCICCTSSAPVVVLQSQRNKPLINELPEGSAPVLFKRDEIDDIFPMEFDTITEQIAFRVQHSDGIAVFIVSEFSSFLVENDSWIHTRVSGRVRDVIKSSPKMQIATETELRFQHPGGTLLINGRQVTAHPGAWFVAGTTYLVFLSRFDTDQVFPTGAWRVNADGALDDLIEEEANPFRGMTLNQAVDEIKKRLNH